MVLLVCTRGLDPEVHAVGGFHRVIIYEDNVLGSRRELGDRPGRQFQAVREGVRD